MLLSLNWLKDFVKIPGGVTPAELAARLTRHTVEVEAVIDQAEKYKGVVVGKILEVKKHPNADRLQLALVTVGKETLEIVCGATNIAAGQLVPVALPGAVLPSGVEIKEAEVRGVRSAGMLCAPDELGLGDDHAGILILNKRARVGQPLAEHLGLDDVVLEVDNKSLSNRPDLWGHLGLAREIAAFLGTKFTLSEPKKISPSKTEKKQPLTVEVRAKDLCPRYMAVSLEGIKIGPSPDWLSKRLIAVGLRPINNIVDVTNYVMLELGQPLHAFDTSRIITNEKANSGECKIIVRRANAGETIETLDGEKRKLGSDMLVIADSTKPIAIAGVMGGSSSEISDSTAAVTIESANFDFISVRVTSAKLGLRTESSMRFEKGLDPLLPELGLARAVELIRRICPTAKVVSEVADTLPARPAVKLLEFNLSWLSRKLGDDIKASKVAQILTGLGFGVKAKGENLAVTVPGWRAVRDIEIAEDLAEEVARIYGFDNLKSRLPAIVTAPPETDENLALERRIKVLLSGGPALVETSNYSFVGEEQLKKMFVDYGSHLKILNPLSSQHTLLRQSLVPNLLENIKLNQPRYKEIGLYEIGSVYLSAEGELDKGGGGRLPYQERRLGIILADDGKIDILRKIKGAIEYLLDDLNLPPAEWRGSEIIPAWADPAGSAEIMVSGKMIGAVNRVAAKIGKSLGLKKSAVAGELNLRAVLDLVRQASVRAFQEFEKFPPVIRDLAFVVNTKIPYSDIRAEIVSFSPLIKRAELFDVFEGGKLGAKNKNLAFSIVYQADRTMTSEEIDELQKGLIKRLEERFGAKVRDF